MSGYASLTRPTQLIQASSQPGTVLARRFGVGVETIARWQHRDSVEDRPHTAHRLQTTLSPGQEAMVVYLRRALLLPLDDLLAVTREFLCPEASRSGLDRCLRRHGVGNLRALCPAPDTPAPNAFTAYEPGFVHVDVKYLPPMADQDRQRYWNKPCTAISRSTTTTCPRKPWIMSARYRPCTAGNAHIHNCFLNGWSIVRNATYSVVHRDKASEMPDVEHKPRTKTEYARAS